MNLFVFLLTHTTTNGTTYCYIMLQLFYISQITCRPACLPHLPIRVLIHHKTRARTLPISPVSQTTRARTRPNSPVHRTTQARTPPADPVATQVEIRQEILARTRPISPVHRTTQAQARPISPVCRTSQPSLRLRQALPSTRVPPQA